MKIETILSRLSIQDKIDLYHRLESDLNSEENLGLIKSEPNRDQLIQCPHCKSTSIIGHGIYKGRKRYRCMACLKTFNDLTGTAGAYLKRPDLFHQYTKMIVGNIPVRKAAKTLGVNVKTVSDWRHKISATLEGIENEFIE
ncbi:MAG TPA: hypothetical protein DEO70_08115 [Bacteroidales bacterium]|nr:MAG: hypothetical protein A2X11_15990 [Bacteroidetes bacterium GWE2_42_24]OFY29228.1 MAG: hypothetical protein A2X09_05850 [Bacteroidetes bacterium GWF2_43_11]PKP27942.1 MAG: hypothetical protein CVU06_00545 [Bacteroidetes bacterium HGW-Bacteroidetes-22]HBZ66789.1 hypothetical protein [Bacteroidales bacterium]